MSETVIRARIDPSLKQEATEVLHRMGLSMSEAIRVFLTQTVAQGCLPFVVKTPNAPTQAAMEAALRGETEPVSLEQLAEEWRAACDR